MIASVRTTILLTAFILAGVSPAQALFDPHDYDTVDDIERDLDAAYNKMVSSATAAGAGPLEDFDLVKLRNLLSARNYVHFAYFLYGGAGGPFSKESIEQWKIIARTVSKYDQEILEFMNENLERMSEPDRDEAQTILDTINESDSVYRFPRASRPPKEGLDQEEYREKLNAYLWYRIDRALFHYDYATALNILESPEFLENEQSCRRSSIIAGFLHYYYEDYKSSADCLEKALPDLPRKSTYFLDITAKKKDIAQIIARIYEDKLQDYKNADRFYAIAYEDSRDVPWFLNDYAWFLIEKTGDIGRARVLLEQASAQEPDDPHIMDTYGYLLLKEGKPTEAGFYFKKALEDEQLDMKAREAILDRLSEAEEKAQTQL